MTTVKPYRSVACSSSGDVTPLRLLISTSFSLTPIPDLRSGAALCSLYAEDLAPDSPEVQAVIGAAHRRVESASGENQAAYLRLLATLGESGMISTPPRRFSVTWRRRTICHTSGTSERPCGSMLTRPAREGCKPSAALARFPVRGAIGKIGSKERSCGMAKPENCPSCGQSMRGKPTPWPSIRLAARCRQASP